MSAINNQNEVCIFKVGDWAGVKGNSTKWISKVVAIEYKTIYDSRGYENKIEILLFEDGTRLGSPWAAHATQEEIVAGHRIDNGKCPHGYDIACLLCGFGTEAGKRIYHQWAKERPISRKRARKLRKRHGVSVYFSKRLECLVWVKTA